MWKAKIKCERIPPPPQIEIAFDIKDVQLAKNHICNWGGKLFIRANGKSCLE